MRGATKLAAWLAADACLMLVSSAGCNAVFGLEERDFSTGGGSSTSEASTSDATSSDASSSSSSSDASSAVSTGASTSTGDDGSGAGGEGGSGGGTGGAGGDLCETTDWIAGGDFSVDSETLWDDTDDVTVTGEIVEGDRVMHLDPAEGVDSSTTQSLSGDICAGGCIRVSLEVRALVSNDFGIGMADDDTDQGGLRLIDSRNVVASETFTLIETDPCLIPDDFVSPDRISFAFDDGGDMYVDDVMVIVDDCPEEAELCERF